MSGRGARGAEFWAEKDARFERFAAALPERRAQLRGLVETTGGDRLTVAMLNGSIASLDRVQGWFTRRAQEVLGGAQDGWDWTALRWAWQPAPDPGRVVSAAEQEVDAPEEPLYRLGELVAVYLADVVLAVVPGSRWVCWRDRVRSSGTDGQVMLDLGYPEHGFNPMEITHPAPFFAAGLHGRADDPWRGQRWSERVEELLDLHAVRSAAKRPRWQAAPTRLENPRRLTRPPGWQGAPPVLVRPGAADRWARYQEERVRQNGLRGDEYLARIGTVEAADERFERFTQRLDVRRQQLLDRVAASGGGLMDSSVLDGSVASLGPLSRWFTAMTRQNEPDGGDWSPWQWLAPRRPEVPATPAEFDRLWELVGVYLADVVMAAIPRSQWVCWRTVNQRHLTEGGTRRGVEYLTGMPVLDIGYVHGDDLGAVDALGLGRAGAPRLHVFAPMTDPLREPPFPEHLRWRVERLLAWRRWREEFDPHRQYRWRHAPTGEQAELHYRPPEPPWEPWRVEQGGALTEEVLRAGGCATARGAQGVLRAELGAPRLGPW
ncbi:MAG TPA: hypothetical protein VGC67_12090 [Cellulomonas sp.]